MKILFDPRYVLGIAGICFSTAYIDSLSSPNHNFDCWFNCLHTVGKIATVLFCIALTWLFVSNIFKLGR